MAVKCGSAFVVAGALRTCALPYPHDRDHTTLDREYRWSDAEAAPVVEAHDLCGFCEQPLDGVVVTWSPIDRPIHVRMHDDCRARFDAALDCLKVGV